eukprot:767301-Hanusia_phi.AAC.1
MITLALSARAHRTLTGAHCDEGDDWGDEGDESLTVLAREELGRVICKDGVHQSGRGWGCKKSGRVVLRAHVCCSRVRRGWTRNDVGSCEERGNMNVDMRKFVTFLRKKPEDRQRMRLLC